MLTEKQKRAYINNYGKCPYCGSWELDGDSYDADGNLIVQQIHCLACQRYWNDVYTLTGIEEVQSG